VNCEQCEQLFPFQRFGRLIEQRDVLCDDVPLAKGRKTLTNRLSDAQAGVQECPAARAPPSFLVEYQKTL
jgi:hypothetical protein